VPVVPERRQRSVPGDPTGGRPSDRV